jgi:hypothetical protein
MNSILTIWRADLKSLRNAARRDTRMQVALAFMFIFNIAFSAWSVVQLTARMQQWQAAGSGAVNAGLWSLCLLTWSGLSFFTIVSVQRALSGNESLLLFTLPIEPATRFRALFGSFLIENLWPWLLLQAMILGYVLLSRLGWRALAWLFVLESGIVIAVFCTLIAALLFIRYLLPRGRIKSRVGAALSAGLTIALIALFATKIALGLSIVASWLQPEIVGLLFTLLLAGALGPGAAPCGRLYAVAFDALESRDRARKSFTLPGARALKRIFERRRDLVGALFARAALNQSRNPLTWLRLALILAALMFFPSVRSALAHYGFPDALLVAGYAAGLAIVQIIETGPGAISGEGNRLALYLTAPFDLLSILRAKLALFLLPVLFEELIIALFLSWRFGLALSQVGFVVAAAALIVIGCTTLLVLGSVWDLDLNLAIEGAVEAILQEEAPVSPRRMALFNLCLLLFVAMFLLLWKLPPVPALVTLIALDLALVIGMQHLSCKHLQRLLKVG